SKNWEMSLEMANAAVAEGVTHILATPHHMNRHWMNPKYEVIALVDELQERLDEENIPLTIFPGQEVRLHGEILGNIQNDEICFIDEMNQISDRKSTRLNSSHVSISYAVFCLKKKKIGKLIMY